MYGDVKFLNQAALTLQDSLSASVMFGHTFPNSCLALLAALIVSVT